MSRSFSLLCLLVLPVSATAFPLSIAQPSRLAALASLHGSHELEQEDALDAARARTEKKLAHAKFGSASQWAVAAPSPVARHGGASAVVNERIYVFGGYGADGSSFIPQRDSHVYNPATNAWLPIALLPEAITHAQAAVIGSKIYLAGGELGDGSQQQRVLLDTVYVYNTTSNQWSSTEIPPLPQLRSSGGFVALGTELHYIAGTRPASPEDIDVGDHFVFDTANPGAGWVTRAPLPDPRNHFQAIAHQGRIYVIGGQKRHNIPAGDLVGYTYLATSYVYTPGTNLWAPIASLPIGISELERASFTFNDKIVIGGGVATGSQPLDASYALEPPSVAKPLGEWIRWPTLPAKRRSPILQRVNQRVIYGTGGGDFDGLRPETAMWTNKIRSDAPRVLFVRGASATGGFMVAGTDAERTEHLSDVNDHSTASSNYGWGQLRGLLESEGFVVEQVIEPVALESLQLSQYSVVVMGSNNASYAPASVDALENFIRARGAALFVADMRFGSTYAAAANSDNFFLSRFGISMHQGLGSYALTRTPDFLVPTHPIWLGINEVKGLPAAAGDVVSPARIGTVPVGVTLEVLARAEGNVQENDGSPGTVRAADASDVALLAGTVQGGRFAALYDRDGFVNEKLTTSASSLVAVDNLDFAVNLFDWLAARRDGALLSDGFEDPVP